MVVFENPENLTLVSEVITTADTFTSGWLGYIIWLIIFFGSLMLTSNFNMRDSLISSTFVGFVLSIILWLLGLLEPFMVFVSLVLFLIAFIFSFIKGNSGA